MDGARIIEDQFELEDLDKLQVLKLSHLEHVGRVDIERCPLLHTVEMPSLYSIRSLEEREELCSDGTKCTVEGPLSPACKEALKEGKAEKEEKKTDDLFDLSGLDVGKMLLGGKFDLGLKEGLGGLRFRLGGRRRRRGEIKERSRTAESALFLSLCWKKRPRCMEMESTEVMYEFESFSLNSTADLQELENYTVIIGDVQLGIAAPTDLELPVLQVFAQSTPPVRIIASNNSPKGLEMRYCSLYVEQVDELRENECQANADPPCFVLSGGSRECAAKKEKQSAGSESFGLFGDTFKFELPKF
uniref:Uncharacterized protein n=1 Tax=Chromera velia CCMP2878 TaxID=1169474 RepID=A0A0G4FVB9_9ALVE|eukprot:Cvel_18949.t1-p1 / transcript=Cvel_18949.t1 / gene=Cvel_18949 / organism=Chromera_velia_CCMP2878 / gene_product=hypothetical protein / transcript_product=hypothetical protein / location=Cvel_scaffold1601:17410-22473(+) / protein_length=301 / sequence_SO=supercontig / SO=protein_coding / is_pseudo=false